MSRTARIAQALTIGYGFQLVVMVTGLWLTPFFLRYLGVADFGHWLVVGQVLAYLGLLDLGVTAILPREVAAASGMADQSDRIPDVVCRATWLVWIQTPCVALVAGGVWIAIQTTQAEVSGPLGLILTAYTLTFPLRVYSGVLTGLQDLAFTGILQAASWAITTVTSVGLVLAGAGLYALAAGWVVGQGTTALAGWFRVRYRFPEARPRGGWPGWSALRRYIAMSSWTSLRMVAQLLLNGTELIVLVWLLGPAAVVVYTCTTKLVSIANSQPSMVVNAALPAVSELRALGDQDRLWQACRALGVGLMLFSGALAIAVVAMNPAFVPLWVGAEQYAGPSVTLLAVLAMVARHWTFTLLHTAFALGYDRLLALVAIADGVVSLSACAAWVGLVGVIGVPLGSMTGLVLTNAPVAVWAVARLAGVSPFRVVGWSMPWVVRFAVVFVPIAVLSYAPQAASVPIAAALVLGGLGVYTALTYSLLNRQPLRDYRAQMISRIRLKFRPRPVN